MWFFLFQDHRSLELGILVIVICLIFDICYLEFNLQRNLYGVKLEPGPLGLDA